MGMSQMNGGSRRPPNVTRAPPASEKQLYAQHDDLIKYIYDSWSKISQEVSRNAGNSSSSTSAAVYYQEQEHQKLRDFEPFDLEAYWARQVVQNYQQQHS